MLAALALTLLPAVQETAAISTDLDGFQELAVEYAQGGAILRTWLSDGGGDLRGLFRVIDRRPETSADFQVERLLDWPMAWTFGFQGGVSRDVFLAGPNQLHHPEQGRLTLDPTFVALLQSRLASQAGGAIALRMENPMPSGRQDVAAAAQATLGQPWTAATVEVRGAAPVALSLDGASRPVRVVLTGSGDSLPDGGAKLTLQQASGEELVLRLLQASRAPTTVYGHTWAYMPEVGAVWIPNDWLRELLPDWPSLAPKPDAAALKLASGILENPIRLAHELELVALETRPLEGEYGPPRIGSRKAPVARMPTRVWAQGTFEPVALDRGAWPRRVADLERRGAGRVLVRGKGEAGPWELLLLPLSETEALVPYLGKMRFPGKAWGDLQRVVAGPMGVEDPATLRLVPR